MMDAKTNGWKVHKVMQIQRWERYVSATENKFLISNLLLDAKKISKAVF